MLASGSCLGDPILIHHLSGPNQAYSAGVTALSSHFASHFSAAGMRTTWAKSLILGVFGPSMHRRTLLEAGGNVAGAGLRRGGVPLRRCYTFVMVRSGGVPLRWSSA